MLHEYIKCDDSQTSVGESTFLFQDHGDEIATVIRADPFDGR
jgi:hypothetical protein